MRKRLKKKLRKEYNRVLDLMAKTRQYPIVDFSEPPDLPPIHTVFHSEYFKDVMAEWFSTRTMLENFHARPTFFDVSAIAPPRQLVCVCDECRNKREEGLKVRIA